MSILYEALKKAETETKGQKLKRKSDKEFVATVRKLEESQQKAIDECIQIARPKERSDAVSVAFIVVVSMCLIALLSVSGVALYRHYARTNEPAQVLSDPLVVTAETVSFQPSEVRVAPTVVSFREDRVSDTSSPQEPVAAIAPERTVTRDVVSRPVRATKAFIDTMVGKAPAVVEPVTPEFVCSGIILVDAGNMCILNGSVKYVGDSVNGAHIEEIAEELVVLSRAGEKITVPLIIAP